MRHCARSTVASSLIFLTATLAACKDYPQLVIPLDRWGGAPEADAGPGSQSDSSAPNVSGPLLLVDAGGLVGCNATSDCDGGICAGGSCCQAQNVCGQSCCAPGQTCFASACVEPGKVCHSSSDCDPGQYCEPSLGSQNEKPDGGSDAQAGVPAGEGGSKYCGPSQPAGRCLAMPPECPADADGGLPDAGACTRKCEYHPSPGGLNVQEKWHWGPVAAEYPSSTDVWSTPLIGRVTDTNCDGVVDAFDSPNVVVVSGDIKGTCCECTGEPVSACQSGVLRVLDGATGQEIWSLAKASPDSVGFAGMTQAIADIDGDGHVDIVAVTGEGRIALIDSAGHVMRISDKPIPGSGQVGFGWGGGLAIADMDGDGFPEIAYGATVYSTAEGAITWKFTGAHGAAASANPGVSSSLSTFVDLDGDGKLELLAGKTAYRFDGTELWNREDLADGYPAVGDFDADGKPDAVLVASGKLYLLEGSTGATKLGPVTLPGTGYGGGPTVADFDGDTRPEIGVAQQNRYAVLKPDFTTHKLGILWQSANHDFSSSVTGSSVFDFQGDGRAEVVYSDECFLWVFDGKTGATLFATQTSSFTATEASLVADIDGDGHAELLVGSNGVDPGPNGFKCNVAPWNQSDPATGRPAWVPPGDGPAYRGIRVFGDRSNGWVGTRTIWNQHTYHVSNICDSRDSACDAPNLYGSIPKKEKPNWKTTWLNNFRQNVQDKGLFNAPDATVSVRVPCSTPLTIEASIRNLGQAILPAGVRVGFYVRKDGVDTELGTASTDAPLFPGQVNVLSYPAEAADSVTYNDAFVAKILVDPQNLLFHECRDDNNVSAEVKPDCQSIR